MKRVLYAMVLTCASLHLAAADIQTMSQQEKERRILASIKGTPTETDAPRDILVNKPDYVVFVPRQSYKPEKRDSAKTGDTYNDHFQVINNPTNGHLYAFWTQASKEGDIDQHIAFSKSVDEGLTWSTPVVLAGSANKKNPQLRASWQQPMLAKGGRLYCLWNQQTTSQGPHCGMMFGAFSDDEGETWSSPKLVPFKERTVDQMVQAARSGKQNIVEGLADGASVQLNDTASFTTDSAAVELERRPNMVQ